MTVTKTIMYDERTQEYYIEIDELATELGWVAGDTIEWIDNLDGTFTLKKKEKEE